MVTVSSNPDPIIAWLEQVRSARRDDNRLLVTISYAQSLDGSLTVRRGMPVGLSGEEAMRMTHRLRSVHDAILVGIGTVIADDPQLNVRLVDGRDPQPVILDSRLRMPLECRLMRRTSNLPWIACAATVEKSRQQVLRQRGADIIPLPRLGDRGLDLHAMLVLLFQRGIRTLMIEGGARVLTSFLGNRLADFAVITIAPRWLGGLNVISSPHSISLPGVSHPVYEPYGEDIVVAGELEWVSP